MIGIDQVVVTLHGHDQLLSIGQSQTDIGWGLLHRIRYSAIEKKKRAKSSQALRMTSPVLPRGRHCSRTIRNPTNGPSLSHQRLLGFCGSVEFQVSFWVLRALQE